MRQLFVTSIRDFEKNTMGTVDMMEAPMPEPKDEEIRIKVVYASICGSDTHILTGNLGEMESTTRSMLPMSFGHELSGVIDKVGSTAEKMGFKVGQKVVANYAKYCGCCENCREGKVNLCSNMGYRMNGFSEYAVYHMSQIFPIPDDADLKDYALVEPLTVALSSAEQAKISYGKSVAIMGAGGLGMMLVQLARLAGASTITVFDIVPEKLELALENGADYALNSAEEGVAERAIELAGGRYDCVLEGTGATAAAKLGLQLLARDGDAVYFAMYGKDPILPVNLQSDLYWDQKHIHGMIQGAWQFPKSIRMIPRMAFSKIIQKEHTLTNYKQAFEDLYSKKYAKIVIKMDE